MIINSIAKASNHRYKIILITIDGTRCLYKEVKDYSAHLSVAAEMNYTGAYKQTSMLEASQELKRLVSTLTKLPT